MKMKKKNRNSGLELLRIICMFLIIAHHYSIHGGYDNFSYLNLSYGAIYVQALSMFGKSSCSIFAIISGYFLVCSDGNDRLKKIMPLIFNLFFYSIVIWLVFYVTGVIPISVIDSVKSFFPIFWGNWYVVYYILMYILSPFINPWLLTMDKKQYTKMIIALIIIWSIVPTFTNGWRTGDMDMFIVMYILGAYLRLHSNSSVVYKNKWNFITAVISAFIMILSVFIFDILGIFLKNNFIIENANYFCKYYNIFAVIWSVSMFLGFLHMDLKNSLINTVASSMLGVYLIHDNFLMSRYIWRYVYPNKLYINSPYIHSIIKIFSVFFMCLILDIIKKMIFDKMLKFLSKKHKQLNS